MNRAEEAVRHAVDATLASASFRFEVRQISQQLQLPGDPPFPAGMRYFFGAFRQPDEFVIDWPHRPGAEIRGPVFLAGDYFVARAEPWEHVEGYVCHPRDESPYVVPDEILRAILQDGHDFRLQDEDIYSFEIRESAERRSELEMTHGRISRIVLHVGFPGAPHTVTLTFMRYDEVADIEVPPCQKSPANK